MVPATGSDVELVSVAAVAANGVIGRDGEIPWENIEADTRQYRERVADAPVIMGRVTFESMVDSLPGTGQVVLSRSERIFDVETAHHASGVEEAVAVVESLDAGRAFVIGGAGIYRLFQPVVDRMVLSRVPGEYDGDAFYPEWDADEWTRTETVQYDEFTVEEWVRKPA